MKTKDFIRQQWVKDEIIKRLNYNPETGSLTWATRNQPHFDRLHAGNEVGAKWVAKDGYRSSIINLEIGGRKVSVVTARVCWLVFTGDWPVFTIDHINRDSFDNRFCNLRDVPQSVNNDNRGFYKGRFIKGFTYLQKEQSWYLRASKGEYIGRFKCFGQALKAKKQYENTLTHGQT